MDIEWPEERLAKRIIERFDLRPPIEVKSLVERYADLTFVDFPVQVDGITVGLKQPGRRPRVYVNRDLTPRRTRFTLAHELGHILLPSHVGSIVDDLDIQDGKENSRYWRMEGEANRFAAELLMPTAWASDILDRAADISRGVNSIAEKADVSIDAAVLKGLKLGPAGYVIAKAEGRVVKWAARTKGTMSNCPNEGASVSRNLISPASEFGSISAYQATYYWWREKDSVALPPKPVEDWRAILDQIMQDVCPANVVKTKQSINGIVAFANSATRGERTYERIYAACLQKIRNRSDQNKDIRASIEYARFLEFITAKVYTLKL